MGDFEHLASKTHYIIADMSKKESHFEYTIS